MPVGDFNLDVVGLSLWALAFILAATCHEAAHALAGYLGGDETAYEAGQVTLNPLPHIQREPFGMIVVPVISYLWMGWMIGWASAPYDPHWADRHPKRAAVMAAAGPLANFTLVIICAVAIRVLIASGIAVPDGASLDSLVVATQSTPFLDAALKFLSISVVLNAILGVFNLYPVPPLDGSAIVLGIAQGFGLRGLANFMDTLRREYAFMGLLFAWLTFRFIMTPVLVGVFYLCFWSP